MGRIAIPELDTMFLFQRRPTSLPADLRPSWRVGLLVLLLRKCCRGNTSSLARLHVLSWGVLSRDNRLALQRFVRGEPGGDQIVVRIEPSLNRAIALAVGEKLATRPKGDKIALTPKGIELADVLDHSQELFLLEKELIASVGKRVTEGLVQRIFDAKS